MVKSAPPCKRNPHDWPLLSFRKFNCIRCEAAADILAKVTMILMHDWEEKARSTSESLQKARLKYNELPSQAAAVIKDFINAGFEGFSFYNETLESCWVV